MTAFRWNAKREEAAALVAADTLTDEQIADRLSVSRQTLAVWKRHPAFIARINEHLDAVRAALRAEGIANRQNRIDALNERWAKMLEVIAERGDDPDMLDVPGGPTGLLVHQTKAVGTGQNQTIIDEYAVDAGLLRELRAHEEQAAKELGQWTERSEMSLALNDEIEKLAREFDTTPEQVRADLAAMLGKPKR